MSKKHSWVGDQCCKCGLSRKRKTFKYRMAITSQPPYDHYMYETKMVYSQGGRELEKRPDCK